MQLACLPRAHSRLPYLPCSFSVLEGKLLALQKYGSGAGVEAVRRKARSTYEKAKVTRDADQDRRR